MFRALAATLALGFAFTTTACGNLFGPHNGSIAGTYVLQSVNGSAVPTQIAGTAQTQGYTIVVQSGGVQLTSSKYIEQMVLAVSGNGQNQTATAVDSGTYAVQGSTVTFTSTASGSQITGTMSGSTLSVGYNDPTLGSLGLQYAKQ